METTLTCARCKITVTRQHRGTPSRFCSARCQQKDWVANNREKLNKSVREYRARKYKKDGKWRDEGKKAVALKEWMVELKSKPCVDCNGIFPICCMDFDHLDGKLKCYNIGSMFAHHYSKDLIQTELDKCELVCSNCHRIRTRNRKTGHGKNKQ